MNSRAKQGIVIFHIRRLRSHDQIALRQLRVVLATAEQIGSIAPGMQADIIALDGNPLTDITAIRRVAFVIKGGIDYKHLASSTLADYSGSQP